MIKKLLFLLALLNCSLSYAQTIKTDVLVIGGGISGLAAAIQCAHSKVKISLVIQSDDIVSKAAIISLEANRDITSRIWDEFPLKAMMTGWIQPKKYLCNFNRI